jgi:hypothetical protein
LKPEYLIQRNCRINEGFWPLPVENLFVEADLELETTSLLHVELWKKAGTKFGFKMIELPGILETVRDSYVFEFESKKEDISHTFYHSLFGRVTGAISRQTKHDTEIMSLSKRIGSEAPNNIDSQFLLAQCNTGSVPGVEEFQLDAVKKQAKKLCHTLDYLLYVTSKGISHYLNKVKLTSLSIGML